MMLKKSVNYSKGSIQARSLSPGATSRGPYMKFHLNYSPSGTERRNFRRVIKNDDFSFMKDAINEIRARSCMKSFSKD